MPVDKVDATFSSSEHTGADFLVYIGLKNPTEHMQTYATHLGGGGEEGEGFC